MQPFIKRDVCGCNLTSLVVTHREEYSAIYGFNGKGQLLTCEGDEDLVPWTHRPNQDFNGKKIPGLGVRDVLKRSVQCHNKLNERNCNG